MTDANLPANGHMLGAQSADITPAVSDGTSGAGAPAGEETRPAPDSGEAGARQRPPGAASPAGWFPSPAGEAAPPVRNREPARSGETTPDAEPDPRPTSWYRIPGPLSSGALSSGALSPGARRLRVTSPAPASPAPRTAEESTGANPAGPAPRWPLITPLGPRNIPVVGPTEALRAPAASPGSANPGAASSDATSSSAGSRPASVPGAASPSAASPGVTSPSAGAPPAAVPGQVTQARESGWQLAHRAWRDSGRDWETAPGRPPVPGPRQPDTFARRSYGSGPYAVEPFAPDSFASASYAPDVFAPDPYALDPYGADEYPADGDAAGEYTSGAYAAAPHAPDAYAPHGADTGAQDVAPYRRGSRASRLDREDSDATRVDFGMPQRPSAASHGRYPAAPPAPRFYPADPRAEARHAEAPYAAGGYADASYAEDGYAEAPSAADGYRQDGYAEALDAEDSYTEAPYAEAPNGEDGYAGDGYAEDAYTEDSYAEDSYVEGAYAGDRYAVDPDDRARPAGAQGVAPGWADEPHDARYAAAPVLEDSRTGVGPWPVQPLTADPAPRGTAARPAAGEAATADDEADQGQGGRAAAAAVEDRAGGGARDRWQETRADRAAPRWSDAIAPGDDAVPTTLRYARQPPPLPRRTPQPGTGWKDQPAGRLPGQQAHDDRSGRVRLPAAPVPEPLSATHDPLSAAQFTAPAAFSEPDELFRAWQGSVREAAGPGARGRGVARRPAGQAAGRRRAWQVAKIGVPAVVIVTVGAGALLMLTGRANEMLAERSSTGPARTGQATSSAASMILGGYPGVRGGVTVAAMWSASGSVVAVGMADGHPAIWRRAPNGGWTLVSAAALGGMSGHLTSVANGPAGWIAVGSVTSDGVAQPMVYTSADGVTWRTVPALTAFARSDAQFLGVAAGRGGYLVVGREGTGKQKFAQLWWSPDLANWTAGGSSGYHNSLAIAAVADGDGFVAAGSQADCHTVWTSPDGTHWTTHDIPRPAGAQTATLRYAAVGSGGRVVTAGFATNAAGAIPIVVTTDPGGAHITQVVLPAGGVPGSVTGVTATGSGFVAAGMIGPAKAQRAVTWTSADGLTWSAATPVNPASGTTITALTSTGGTVTGTLQAGMDPAVQTLPAP